MTSFEANNKIHPGECAPDSQRSIVSFLCLGITVIPNNGTIDACAMTRTSLCCFLLWGCPSLHTVEL